MSTVKNISHSLFALLICTTLSRAADTNNVEDVQAEHEAIGNAANARTESHTMNPDAQWYGDAGLGLFIHWGIASVKGINISWSMIEGLDGKPAQITPNDYWAMAKDFNPQNYDPDKWLKAAKAAGFKYAVLTTRHHEGFALWPSAYGNFSTKNYMGGRDLVKQYVEACRKNGLKVGLYYSPPDWYFERATKNFSRVRGHDLGPDGKERTTKPTPEEMAAQRKAYIQLVRGQITELLTRYGKIDLLWFDGKIPGAGGDEVMPLSEIRKLQPGIVVDSRFHGHGDFKTYERRLTTDKVAQGWAEYCNTWTTSWPYVKGAEYRANGFILGQYVLCRSLHINYLPDVGPMANGELQPQVYTNFEVFHDWMKANGESVHDVTPLPDGESASVPATASGSARYLFALPEFKAGTNAYFNGGGAVYPEDLLPPKNETLTFTGKSGKPHSATLLRDGSALKFSYTDNTTSVQLPAAKRSKLVDVVKLQF